jgi:hypothetical protein
MYNSHHIIESIKDDTLDVNGRIYFRVPMKRLKGYKYLFHTAFWFPVSKENIMLNVLKY